MFPIVCVWHGVENCTGILSSESTHFPPTLSPSLLLARLIAFGGQDSGFGTIAQMSWFIFTRPAYTDRFTPAGGSYCSDGSEIAKVSNGESKQRG